MKHHVSSIDKSSVNRLCASQVIIDLKSCIKELVDNALDANSNTIKICLVNHGTTLIEVSDNGTGITPTDLRRACTRHSTSKIQSFSEIHATLPSFGFRGEALNSLCSVGDLSIESRTQDVQCGTRALFDEEGQIKSIEIDAFPRAIGTTIRVENLFARYPVRQREFLKNAKSQIPIVLKLVTAYALIKTDVRFILMTQSSSKQHMQLKTLLNTDGQKKSLKSSFERLFGQYAAQQMVEFQLSTSSSSTQTTISDTNDVWSLSGLLLPPSLCHKKHRRITFIFINNKPINHGVRKIISALHTVYNLLSSGVKSLQYILCLNTSDDLVDMNVSPDKQTVFIKNEQDIANALVDKVQELFQSMIPSIPQMSQPDVTTYYSQKDSIILADTHSTNTLTTLSSSLVCPSTKRQRIDSIPNESIVSPIETITPTRNSLPESVNDLSTIHTTSSFNYITSSFLQDTVHLDNQQLNSSPVLSSSLLKKKKHILHHTNEHDNIINHHVPSSSYEQSLSSRSLLHSSQIDPDNANDHDAILSTPPIFNVWVYDKPIISSTTTDDSLSFGTSGNLMNSENNQEHASIVETTQQRVLSTYFQSQYKHQPFLSPHFKQKIQLTIKRQPLGHVVQSHQTQEDTVVNLCDRVLKQDIISSKDLDIQCVQLHTHITNDDIIIKFPKHCFNNIRIIGQFNKGFIIGTLKTTTETGQYSDELFIIDQHATDEKYKFEELCHTMQITSQHLVIPIPIDLSPDECQVVMYHKDIFRLNGFQIIIDNPPTQIEHTGDQVDNTTHTTEFTHDNCTDGILRLALSGLPIINNKTLSIEDFYELIHLIMDKGYTSSHHVPSLNQPISSASIIRPSKIRAIMASKACRTAVMIGDPLSYHQMQLIVERMADMKHPWNCPHGRPTMRHLKTIIKETEHAS